MNLTSAAVKTKDIRDEKHTVETLVKTMKSHLVKLSNVFTLIE